jgi:hypothetical protein
MLSAAFSAALALLVTGVGVGFGWQPMPGDASASELVVHVEPAALERLAEGATIPLTADVPAEAGRVARVRLVVGGAPSLARREETRLKPIGEPSTIVLTQYAEPDSRYGVPAPNYGASPSAAQPLATTPTPQTFDPYTQAPPAATAASNWNVAADADASSAAATPLQRIGAEIQTAAQPLQDGVERVGDGVRQFGQNIAGRADQLRDSLGRPLQNGLLGGRSGATTTTAATTSDPGIASQWNGAPTVPATTPMTTTPPLGAPPAATTNGVADDAGSNWNGDAPTASGIGGATGMGNGTSTAPPYAGGANSGSSSATNADRWTNANDPRLSGGAGSAAPPAMGGTFGSPSGASNPGGLGASSGFGSAPGGFGNAGDPGATGTSGNMGGGGSNWGAGAGNTPALPDPPSLTNASGGFGQNGPVLGSTSGGTSTTSGAPELRSWMLGQAGNRGLEGTAATPVTATSPGLGGITPTGQASGGAAAQPGIGAAGNPGGSLLGSQSWATGQQGPATTAITGTAPGAANPAGTAAPDGRQQAAVILAWVLLFASVAGNMYLFWSYLDVRTKYRALVRKTARAVGSRFSAA